jgi:hypothetical protein
MSLDKDTLKLALNAALLSCLAYKTPVQVEYLRLRANGTSQADALKVITQQVRQQREWKVFPKASPHFEERELYPAEEKVQNEPGCIDRGRSK